MKEETLQEKLLREKKKVEVLEKMIEDTTRDLYLSNERLQLANQYLQNIMESMTDALVVVSPDGTIHMINKATIKLTGYTEKELLGKPVDVILGEDLRINGTKITDLVKREEVVSNIETTFLSKDGRRVPVLFSGSAMHSGEGSISGLVFVAVDITERKRAEKALKKVQAQLLQSQKMEAIGQLAGGIAHDFNNLLTSIIGNSNLLMMKMAADEPLRAYVDQILSSAESAAKLTQSLLAFSRKQIISLKPHRLDEIVKNTEKLLLRLIGEDIELNVVFAERDITVLADNGQIQQILMNLATNARDAMPNGGILTIATDTVEITREYEIIHGYGKPGKYAVLSVTDTGIGMDEETRRRIFEPFFTTKGVGEGTGLGLAIIYGIVKQHKGYINVYSEPGKGTTFKIYLPMITSKVEEHEPIKMPDLKIAGGTETLLLAEDNPKTRNTIKTILEDYGYRVIEAEDGEDAIEKFRQNKETIRLFILDVVMPKKNGKDVYEEIKQEVPDIKAIFTSGYTSDIVHRKGILEEELEFISKPFSPGELLRKVREVLSKPT